MEQKHIKIELTDEQKAELEQNTGKAVDSIELSVEELEQRIAPRSMSL
jgi:hypothetical protein